MPSKQMISQPNLHVSSFSYSSNSRSQLPEPQRVGQDVIRFDDKLPSKKRKDIGLESSPSKQSKLFMSEDNPFEQSHSSLSSLAINKQNL